MDSNKGRQTLWLGVVAAVALGASALGAIAYLRHQESRKPAPIRHLDGFDIAQVSPYAAPAPSRPGATPEAPSSGLNMVKPAQPGMRFGTQPGSTSRPGRRDLEGDITEKIRREEGRVRSLAMKYTKKYPVIMRYGRDWMSYPDLAALDKQYQRDRDPVKFMKGVARSPNFHKLLAKYAREPAIQAFVMDLAKQAPGELTALAAEYLSENVNIRLLVENVAQAMGLPPALFGLNEDGIVGRNR
ncbi:MAG: hypothetical protein HY549_11130 [Elusimicrobia bacterium]|nr:hypothetical protein [Elusimicrobiota bacterium]